MMTAQLKNFLTITLKNAVNAVLASGILKVLVSGFHFNSGNDWWNFGKAMLSVIVAREVMVWGPLLLQWSVTSANPAAIRTPSGGLDVPAPKS